MDIPLFPLHTVLYPSAPITLHIFEERYRQMISICLQQHSPFGIVFIRSGSEIDPNDPFILELRSHIASQLDVAEIDTIPYAVGTTVLIREAHRLEDGRYYLQAVGQKRFRIQRYIQHRPYFIATVEMLNELDEQSLEPSAEQLRQLYTRYWQTLARATGKIHEIGQLPTSNLELSYLLATRLQVENTLKQRWLELDAGQRLRALRIALQREITQLGSGDLGKSSMN